MGGGTAGSGSSLATAEPRAPANATPALAKDLEGRDVVVSTVRHIGPKTFYLKDGRWVDSTVQPEEAALAREIASELQPAELRAWFDDLAALSVPDAVAKIRGLIGKGGAS